MAAPAAAAPGAPLAPLTLAPLERPAFAALFAAADPAGSGIITGAAAVDFFGRSRPPLAPTLLGAIWSIADRANNGFLGKAEWAAAMRLIGHAQRGTPLERLESMLSQPGPPPAFDGVVLPGAPAGSAPGTPVRNGSISQASPAALATITPADRARYTRIFASAGPQNGMIDGEKAKGIFVRSKLPFEQLGAIWNLADTRARGALDLTDFIIGMHFLQATMNGSLAALPAQLPPGLYEQASGGPSLPLAAQHTGGSASGGAGLPRQLTGSGGYLPRQLTGQQGYGTPASPQASNIRAPSGASYLSPQRTGFAAQQAAPAGGDWSVSAADKAKADRFFDGLDTERKGTLEGQAAVPFFMQSGLPEATLAHVWDLSDITQSGSLSREEFAVAMHLINGALAGQQMPQELPEALIPPSLRGQNLPAAVNPQESDTQRDLFSLMDDDPAPLPVNTASAFITPASSAAPARAAAPAASGPFDDDFFGQPANFAAPQSVASPVLSPAPTGTSAARAAVASPAPATPIGDAGAEVGNKRLAIDSTQKSVKELQAKRGNLESGVASSASSIAELESRLASLRTTHEAESSAVRALEERASKQAAELKTLREEVIRNESELSALRAEKDEVEQTVMRDREDVRDMKKRMAEVQQETMGLKNQLEKLRKEARQQKGLVAISKKQLATAEGEGEKLRGDIAAVEAGETAPEEVKSPTIEPIGIKSPEGALSPAASVRSTNPFDRFNPVSSPSSPATHNNAALALGGAAAGGALGLGAAAAVHSHEEAAPSGTRAVGAPEGADPFGVPQTSQDAPAASQAPAAPATAGFDDSFGNDFDAPASAAPASGQAAAPAGSAFDDAFADFDDKPTEAAPAAEAGGAQEALAVEPPKATRGQSFDDFEASFAPPGALEPPTAAAPEEASAPAPTADEVATDADVIEEAPSADKGKAPAAADEDDSSDEDEGPEDLEGPRTASPNETSLGKSTDTSATAGAASALPTAQNVNVAAERFPELDDADEAVAAPGSSAGQAPSGSDAFLSSTAPVSSQHTGASGSGDAFEDALTGEAPSAAAAAPAVAAAAPAALATAGSAERSVSPNKTRRAPPPAPVRSNSNFAASSPFDAPASLPPTTSAAPAPAHAPQTASFDDFDAAFEDLGPASSVAPASSAAPAAGNMPGFDDAFGDADDFDFVPSFDNAGAAKGAAPAAAPTDAFNSAFPAPAAGASDAQNGGFGFDDFAASFGDAPAAGAASTAAAGSGAGSGFSFADEFRPSQPASAAGAAPPIPARSQTGGHKATPSGAEPDDVGPVKSLTSMGFDREKVIRALEASNYKVDRALEKLLASA